MTDLTFTIAAKNQASRVFQNVARDADRMRLSISGASKNFEAAGSASQKTAGDTGRLGQSMRDTSRAVELAGGSARRTAADTGRLADESRGADRAATGTGLAFGTAGRQAAEMGRKVSLASRGMETIGKVSRAAVGALKGLAVGSLAVASAAGVLAVKVGGNAVNAASDLNETVSKSGAIFGKNQGEILAWSQNAASAFGLSRQEALAGAAQFGNFFDQIGIGGKRAVDMSKGLVKLSADLGSFSNADPAKVMETFQSATRGEFDSLQQFIPTINAARVQQEAFGMTGKKSAKDLTEAEKALALYSAVQKDAGKAVGDFSRTQAGLANQQRTIKAGFSDMSAALGQDLLPGMSDFATTIRTGVMPVLTQMVSTHGPAIGRLFSSMSRVVGEVAVKLSNFASQHMGAVIGAAQNLASKAGPAFNTLKEHWPAIESAVTSVIGKIKAAFAAMGGGEAGKTGAQFKEMADSAKQLAPVLKDFVAQMPSFNDLLSVGSNVLGFFADHAESLRKWMPAIVAAFVAWKVAQMGANVAAAAAVPLRIAEMIAQGRHTAALAANTAAMSANAVATGVATGATTASTAAENTGILAKTRSRIAAIAKGVAERAVAIATGIATAAQWLFNAALSANPIGLVVLALVALAAGVVYCYNKFPAFRAVIQGAFSAVSTAAKWLWEKAIKPAFEAIVKAANWVWQNGIKPAFESIKRIWENVLRPVFSAIGTAIGAVKNAFGTALDGIKTIWDKLKGVAAAPIKFVIDTVFNKGLISGWNSIASAVGLPKGLRIPLIPVPKFAAGGVVPGYTPGRDVGLAAVSGGEAIMRPEWTRAVGEQRIKAWNEAARNRGPAGLARTMGIPGFADGGIVGAIKNAGANALGIVSGVTRNVTQFLSNPGGFIANMMRGPLSALSRFSDSTIGRGVSGLAESLIGKVVDAIKTLVFSSPGGNGGNPNLGGPSGSSVDSILTMARRFLPGVTVSSGFRNTNDYHGRGLAADLIGGGPEGMAAIARGFYGISGRLLELIHSGGGGFFVKDGQRVPASYYRSVISEHYNHVHVAANRNAMFDRGGWLMPGTTLATNNTGRPERVLGPGEAETLSAPIVIQMDSQVVYQGLMRLKRRMGGTWELVS